METLTEALQEIAIRLSYREGKRIERSKRVWVPPIPERIYETFIDEDEG